MSEELDPNDQGELSTEFISRTLSFFIQSFERLNQMTKTYNNLEVVTQLLEERERDLELAARIGHTLLDRNKHLQSKNDELQNEITSCYETVTQLKHDLNVKSGLLRIYSADLDECESYGGTEADLSPNRSLRSTSSNSFRDRSSAVHSSVNWEILHEKVCELQEENKKLRQDASCCISDLEKEEKKELQLIHDCTQQLTDANIQLYSFQEEAARRAEDNIRQQEEITNLLTQVVDLQKNYRESCAANEALKSALTISHECQEELSSELMDLKEKHTILLAAFHEIQDELRRKNKHNLWPSSYMPVCDSLAAEIESSLGSDGYDSDFASLVTSNQDRGRSSNKRLPEDEFDTHCQSSESVNLERDLLNRKRQSMPNFSQSVSGNSLGCRSLFVGDKLKIVKSLEGSETLKKWKKLATPHLGVILESNAGVQSKALRDLNSELLEYVISKKTELNKKQQEQKSQNTSMDLNSNIQVQPPQIHFQFCSPSSSLPATSFKEFQMTSSTFTFTTTSLSRTTESTMVTPSFSSIQLSTGHQVPISSSSSSYSSHVVTQSAVRPSTLLTQAEPSKKLELPITNTSSDAVNCSTITTSSSTGYNSWSQSLVDKCSNYLSYISGRSPNGDELDGTNMEKPLQSDCKDATPVQEPDSLRDREQAKVIARVNSPLDELGNGLAGMAGLADEMTRVPGIVTKGHSLNFETVNQKLPSKLMSRPRCLPQRDAKMNNPLTMERYSGPICASRTLRKGGYL